MNFFNKIVLVLLLLHLNILGNGVPLISIITSVYNGDEFIEGFMKDITQQSIFDQCELIMINANSPGHHEEDVIKHYMQQYPNIVYVALDYDPGLYGVWNIAIGMARGAFLTNANLDDRLHPQTYETHLQQLLKYPEVDLVYSGYYVTEIPNETFEHHTRIRTQEFPEFRGSKNIWMCLPGNHPMWRKSMHAKYGLFDESYKSAGDYEMWLRAFEGGSICKKVDGIWGLMYTNKRCLSNQKTHMTEVEMIQKKYGYLWSRLKNKKGS